MNVHSVFLFWLSWRSYAASRDAAEQCSPACFLKGPQIPLLGRILSLSPFEAATGGPARETVMILNVLKTRLLAGFTDPGDIQDE